MAQHTRKPYRLPKPLTISPERVRGGVSMEIVKEYITKHETCLRRYEYLRAMHEGFHDIYKAPEKEDWKPDNRLAVNFPRYLVETFMGYAYGIPAAETHPDDVINDRLKDFQDVNDLEDHEYELFKQACIYGHAFEYIYQDEEMNTRVTICTPIELFVVYDDTMKHRALFAIRYGYHEKDGMKLPVPYGEIMTRERIEPFDEGRKLPEGPDGSRDNPYGYINCVEFILNTERMGLFECVCGMNELYNKTIGEKGNDVDAFAEAYLKILGLPVDEDGVRRIRDERVINVFGTDNAKDIVVDFLQRPTADATQENLLDRLEKLTFMMSMVANISDNDFGSASSGVSLSYKLWSTSNLALTFDRKNRKSVRKRYKIWASLSTNSPREDAWKEIEFRTRRNVPKNIGEEIDNAAKLDGQVSRATQLSIMPSVVPDPEAEMEKMLQEQAEEDRRNEERMNRMYGGDTTLAAMQLNRAAAASQAEQMNGGNTNGRTVDTAAQEQEES